MSNAIVATRPQQRNGETKRSFKFALVNWGGSGDEGIVDFAREVAPDVLGTLRLLVRQASLVAVVAIVGYCIVQIMPQLVFLLYGIFVTLPLGIFVTLPLGVLEAICKLLVPLSNLVFLHLLPVIGTGLLALGQGIPWLLSALLVLFLVTALGQGILWVLSRLLSGVGVTW